MFVTKSSAKNCLRSHVTKYMLVVTRVWDIEVSRSVYHVSIQSVQEKPGLMPWRLETKKMSCLKVSMKMHSALSVGSAN